MVSAQRKEKETMKKEKGKKEKKRKKEEKETAQNNTKTWSQPVKRFVYPDRVGFFTFGVFKTCSERS